jgi:hypothetical protein
MVLEIISGTIIDVQVVTEYENEHDQEIDILLDSGPTVEMCVTEDVVKRLRSNLLKTISFEITDRSPCGQHARAISFEIGNHD